MSKVSNSVLDETPFSGTLKFDDNVVPINFRLSAGGDSRLHFELDRLPTKYLALLPIGEDLPGTKVKEYALAGDNPGGMTIQSDRITFDGHDTGDAGCLIRIRAITAKLTMPLEKPIPRPVVRLWFRTFKSFSNPAIETSLGTLKVEGSVTNVEFDDMSGSVALEAYSADPGPEWRKEADAFLRHMHQGLAVARGGRLQTPRLDFVYGAIWESEFMLGRGFRPDLPVQHPLQQMPFINALVSRYEDKGPLDSVYWSVIGWMHMDTSYHEVRFLTAMTAIETLVNHAPEVNRGTVIPKKTFKPIRAKLNSVINTSKSLDEETSTFFQNKIGGLNMKTLAVKIHALFEYYDIPRQDFEGDTILALVKLRNEIVHRGAIPDGVDIWPHVILARELIIRIFLRQIDFAGTYLCYVGGNSTRDFPPTNRIATAQSSGPIKRWLATIQQFLSRLVRKFRR